MKLNEGGVIIDGSGKAIARVDEHLKIDFIKPLNVSQAKQVTEIVNASADKIPAMFQQTEGQGGETDAPQNSTKA